MRKIDSNLIRSYIDGELPLEVEEEVRRHTDATPEARAMVDFEKRLKERVSTVMSSGSVAPSGLAESIRTALDADVQPAAEATHRATEVVPAEGRTLLQGCLEAVRKAYDRLARPRPVSFGAVLAVIGLVGAAVLIGVFAPQIDTIGPTQRTETVADPADYASQEHDRCVTDTQHLLEKLNFCTPQEAAIALREHFGVEGITVFDLTTLGYDFLGESRCGIPGSRQSAHLLYEAVDGDSRSKLSIFIATARGNGCPKTGCGRELRPGEWRRSRGGSECRKRVLQSTDNSLVYYLVGCKDVDAEAVAEVVSETLLARAR